MIIDINGASNSGKTLLAKRLTILLGVSVRVIQSWEQGEKKPSGAARRLLRVAEKNPDVLLAAAGPRRRVKAG